MGSVSSVSLLAWNIQIISLDDKNLKPVWAIEIKWSNRYFEEMGELKSLMQFCENNKLKSALVTTIDKEGIKEYKGVKLTFVPAALYAYLVGSNTIDQKQRRTSK
jgi:hypothetical protein